MDVVLVRSHSIHRPVHLDKLDLVRAILSGHFINDPVPAGHELYTVVALLHEEVNDSNFFRVSCEDVLEIVRMLSEDTLGVIPPKIFVNHA